MNTQTPPERTFYTKHDFPEIPYFPLKLPLNLLPSFNIETLEIIIYSIFFIVIL